MCKEGGEATQRALVLGSPVLQIPVQFQHAESTVQAFLLLIGRCAVVSGLCPTRGDSYRCLHDDYPKSFIHHYVKSNTAAFSIYKCCRSHAHHCWGAHFQADHIPDSSGSPHSE